MPVKLEDIVEKYGLEIEVTDATTIDDVDNAIAKKFVDKGLHETQIKAAVGKRVGAAETKLKQFLGDDGKGKTFDELVELLPTTVAARIKAKEDEIEALKEAGKSTGKEAEQLIKLKTEFDQLKGLLDKANQAALEQVAEKEKEIESIKKDVELKETQRTVNDVFNAVDWVDKTSSYEKSGLYTDEIAGKYVFKIDETGKDLDVYEIDGETIVEDGTKPMKASALFKKEADKAGLLKKNGANGSKKDSDAKIDLTKIESPFVRANLAKAEAKAKALEAAEKK